MGTEKIRLTAMAAYAVDGGIWFVHDKTIPVLFFYDLKKRKITKAKNIPCQKRQAHFWDLCVYREKVFLIPDREPRIVIYSIKEDAFDFLDIKTPCQMNFIKAILKDDTLYCIPYGYDCVVKVNLNHLSIRYGEKWREAGGFAESTMLNSAYKSGNEIWCAVYPTNKIIIYDMEMEKWRCAGYALDMELAQVVVEGGRLYALDAAGECLGIYGMDSGTKYETRMLEKDAAHLSVFGETIILDNAYGGWEILASGEHICSQKGELKANGSQGVWTEGEEGAIYGFNNGNLVMLFSDRTFEVEELAISMEEFCGLLNAHEQINGPAYCVENNSLDINGFVEIVKEI